MLEYFMGKASTKKRAGTKAPAERRGREWAAPEKAPRLRRIVPVLAIVVLGVIAYSNTLSVPFAFDDNGYIADNPLMKDFAYFLSPSDIPAQDLPNNVRQHLRTRYVGYLSFFLNYRLHGLSVTGYHAVNIAVHLLNALLVYLLAALTLRTPLMSGSLLREHSRGVALFAALLFVSHPVQTQAVTYISQRFTSLAALFCLLALTAYVRWRLSPRGANKHALYILSLGFTAAAMLTKEIAFTLPLVIALYEFLFFGKGTGQPDKKMLPLVPFLLCMFIIPLARLDFDRPFLQALDEATRTHGGITRHDYLLTQLRAMVTYLRLLLFPVNQNLDYDYPLYASFFSPGVLLAFLLLGGTLAAALWGVRRSGGSAPGARLAAFCVLWYFITLAVESSVFPLADLMFEHRVYLPSVGIFMLASAGAFMLKERLGSGPMGKALTALLVLVPLAFASAALARNHVWRSPIALWENAVKNSPMKERPYSNLGAAYTNYGTANYSKGSIDRAIESYTRALSLNPEFAEAYINRCNAYLYVDLVEEAIEDCKKAVAINPGLSEAHYNLGLAYARAGRYDEAIESWTESLSLRQDADAYHNRGVALARKGLLEKAVEDWTAALSVRPDVDAYLKRGQAYLEMGRTAEARSDYEKACGMGSTEGCEALRNTAPR